MQSVSLGLPVLNSFPAEAQSVTAYIDATKVAFKYREILTSDIERSGQGK